VPAAERELVLAPGNVLDALAPRLAGASCVLAAGPDGLVRAVAAAAAVAGVPCQVALEAPMACGYGACYSCAVSLEGKLVRLCVEGPVVAGDRLAPA
jgi:dihydroorotate dehydrogenase electron transfer subunit